MQRAPLVICLFLVGCSSSSAVLSSDHTAHDPGKQGPTASSPAALVDVVPVPLTGVFARREAEMSALAWWHDELILCPQYPARFMSVKPGVAGWTADATKDRSSTAPGSPTTSGTSGSPAASAASSASSASAPSAPPCPPGSPPSGAVGGLGGAGGLGAIGAISRATLLAHLDGKDSTPIEPRAISFDDAGLSTSVPGFEGFESLIFSGDHAYLTVERKRPVGTAGVVGHIVEGNLSSDGSLLRLDAATIQDLPVPVVIPNMGFEASSIVNGTLLTFFEANGSAVLASPIVHRFSIAPDGALHRQASLAFPHIDYRITAATLPDARGRIWALNIYWKGEPFLCRAGADEAEKAVGIEQIVELEVTQGGVVRTARPPIVLRPDVSGKARNWEGLARIEGRGFLVVTDEYPDTRLGFVPFVE